MPTQETVETPKENYFDERGNDALPTEETVDAAPEDTPADEEGAPPPETPKFRIGDREFTTQDEALAYANAQVEADQHINNAYQQGMRDAISTRGGGQENVTPQIPAAPELNTEELYTNPQEFLKKYGNSIREQAVNEVRQGLTLQQQSDSIWREFCNRHPSLADFRAEVEQYVQSDTPQVRSLIQTKGRDASYDYIATKLRNRFESYANAIKPNRALPNTRNGASPSTKAPGVTPQKVEKKPLSMIDQIRSIRKGR